MRTGIFITITRSVRGRLEAITRDRNASQKHAWRVAIILSSADGGPAGCDREPGFGSHGDSWVKMFGSASLHKFSSLVPYPSLSPFA